MSYCEPCLRRDLSLLGEAPGGGCVSPRQLDLELGTVVLDLEFNLQMDLVGDVRDETYALSQ